MITKLIILIISLLIWNMGFCCEIILPEKILILENSKNLDVLEEFYKNPEYCSKDILDELSSILNSVDGKITKHQLKEMLATKNYVVEIKPEVTEFIQLKNLIRKQLEIPINHQLTSITSQGKLNSLSLKKNDQIKVVCENCPFEKNQTIFLNILGIDGSFKRLNIQGEFKKMIKAFYVKSYIPAFSEIRKDQLREEFTDPIPHTDILCDLEIIKYFKTNKPLKAGSLIKKSDLNGINLVRAGSSTEVIIENNFLKLKTNGISRSNGTYGDLVEVLNVQKKKKYIGKVIDINKIIVDL